MTRRDFSERDIHLALDGELPADEQDAFRLWLDAYPEMKARNTRYLADRDALREAFSGVLSEPVPTRLRATVLGEAPRRARVPASRWRLAAAAVLLLALGGAGGYFAAVGGLGRDDAAQDQLAEEAIAAHVVYAAEQRHAVEVPASDKDHMQAWLSNRVGLKLVAPDLGGAGFELLGGRLLPAGAGKAAMLLYQDGKGNRISLFITSEPPGSAKGSYAEAANGPRAVYWLDGGYGCVVVGTLPERELDAVADSAYHQLLAGIES
jgi:anti-sigma factor RsiW